MALVQTSAISAALTIKFHPEIASQINRATVLMQLLPKGDGNSGKRLDWVASFGTAVGAARNEGADVSGDGNSDDKVPAYLEYGNYDDHFTITGKAIRAAAAAGNPEQLAGLMTEEVNDCAERLAKGIGIDLYTGSGATNYIHGLTATAGPLAATGIYANINRATYPQWASNVYSNGGSVRTLDRDLMRKVRRGIYEASGRKPDLIICSPGVHEKYGQSFEQQRRYVTEIKMRGQTVILDGGYYALEFDGIPVIEDVDCPDNDMLFLNTSFLDIKQLPDIGEGNPAYAHRDLRGSPEEQFGSRPSGLTARINMLSRAGDYVRFQMIAYPALRSRRNNVHARLTDLAID